MPSNSTASDEPVVPTDDLLISRSKPKRVRNGAAKAPRRKPVALPVLVVDETFLLPHMSIPYPIEDDESAMVIDRSLRMPLRQVLVLTEQMVQENAQAENAESEFAPLFSDLLLGDELPISSDGDEPGGWTPENQDDGVQFELCTVGVIAEVGQRISPPAEHVARDSAGDRARRRERAHPARALSCRAGDRHDDPISGSTDSEAAMTGGARAGRELHQPCSRMSRKKC